jgi:predicted patatin/cPLA2 family phospholipase
MAVADQRMHPVLELLRERAREGSRPGRRHDPAVLGLAIEGGGMRGVVSAGMVTALEALGLRDAFDVVLGASAGAINGAYFLTGQAAYGTTIYYENINNPRFIRPARYFSPWPVLSLEFLLEHVMTTEKVLDWRSVLDSPIPLRVLASSLSAFAAKALGPFRDRDHLFAALRASACIPLIAGGPVVVDGDSFFDALLFEPIPFRSAIAAGCTHVLALLTRPAGSTRAVSAVYERYVASRLARIRPRLGQCYMDRIRRYRDDLALLDERSRRPAAPPHVYAIRVPADTPAVKRLESRRAHLVAGAASGARAAAFAVLGEPPLVRETLAVLERDGKALRLPWPRP